MGGGLLAQRLGDGDAHQRTSTTISTSTGTSSGSTDTPTADRACLPQFGLVAENRLGIGVRE